MNPKNIMVGSYTNFKKRDENSDEVFKSIFEEFRKVVNGVGITIDKLPEEYIYATQVVAGLNYKFHFYHDSRKYELIVYRRFDKTTSITSFSRMNV